VLATLALSGSARAQDTELPATIDRERAGLAVALPLGGADTHQGAWEAWIVRGRWGLSLRRGTFTQGRNSVGLPYLGALYQWEEHSSYAALSAGVGPAIQTQRTTHLLSVGPALITRYVRTSNFTVTGTPTGSLDYGSFRGYAGQHGGAVASWRSTLHVRSWLGVGVGGAVVVGHMKPGFSLNLSVGVGAASR
jgi:hypothetical protein